MDLLPSPEQEEIVASVTGFLAGELPLARVHELIAAGSGPGPATWGKCAQLGWFGLGLPEDLGGVGYGLADEALLFREIGRHLAPGPFLPTVLGARVAAVAGHKELAGAILEGAAAVGLAQPDDLASAAVGEEVTAGLHLVDAAGLDLVVVAVPAGAALVDAAGLVDERPAACIDPATRLATASADHLPAVAFVPAAADGVHLRGSVLVAAMLTGIAEAARDMAAEHARSRVQFGRPIGVHQAVKHACTDMAVRAEAAAAQAFLAALAVEGGDPEGPFQASAAKAVAVDAAQRNAAVNIQVHGGMGFTYEHDAHLLVKRAHVLEALFGDVRHHLRRVLAHPRLRGGLGVAPAVGGEA